MERSCYQQEFDALPEWAKQMVHAVTAGGLCCHGYGHEDTILAGMSSLSKSEHRGFFMGLDADRMDGWSRGFDGLCELASALSAPFPPPTNLPPHEKMTTSNLVEMVTAGDDKNAFDQPCYFGHLVAGHAVYCHNEAWPDSPRKCRRNRTDYPHEACPGFVKNPDWQSDHQ